LVRLLKNAVVKFVLNKVNTPVAKLLSYLFHPLLMSTYLLGVLFFFAPYGIGVDLLPHESRGILLLVVCIYTFIIPVLGVYGMVQLKFVEDITLRKLEDRRYPFWLTVAVYLAATYFFGWKFTQIAGIAPVLRVVLGSITVSIVLVGIISFFWQISAHMTGIGGVTGFLMAALLKLEDYSLLPPFLLALIISGWVAASRLQLNAHTMNEVLAGFLLGLLVCGAGGLLFL
jgi:membrane-associated phospholipid phosphatase